MMEWKSPFTVILIPLSGIGMTNDLSRGTNGCRKGRLLDKQGFRGLVGLR